MRGKFNQINGSLASEGVLEADQEIVRVGLSLLSNFWILTGVLRDVELVTVIVT
jgi:hypothetical protein